MHRQQEVTLIEPPVLQSFDVRSASFAKPAERFSQHDGKVATVDFAFTGARRLRAF